MQITLLTDGSTRANELIEHDLPILVIDNKELNFTKAQRWIKKRVKENYDNTGL